MITVKVTADHISKGLMQRCCLCPIALALRDAFPEADLTFVEDNDGMLYRLVEGEVERARFDLPPQASRFIEKFDGLMAPGPFDFEIEEPIWTDSLMTLESYLQMKKYYLDPTWC